MPPSTSRLLALGLLAGLSTLAVAPGATAAAATAAPAAGAAPPQYTDRTTVSGWGGFDSGQSSRPASLATTDLVAASASDDNSIALSRDGRVTAWGDDWYGQSSEPVALADGTVPVAAVDAGEHHSLALTRAGDVVAWGGLRDTDEGQLDVPADLGPATAISAGRYHSMAIRADGAVVAWGAEGNHGDIDEGQTSVPLALRPGGTARAVDVAAGARHSLAVTATGEVEGWGLNARGQSQPPEELRGPDADAVDVEAYGAASLALTADGRVLGWGDDGTGTVSVPDELRGHRIVDISLGSEVAMALSSTGRVFTWGDSGTPVPASVARHAPFSGIAAGGRHQLVLHRLPKAASRLVVQAPAHARKGAAVTVTVRLSGATSGSAALYDGSRRVATVPLRRDGTGATGRTVLRTLSVGTHRLTARYAGTDLVGSSTSAVESVRITRR